MSILDRIKMVLGIRSPSKEFPKPFIPEHKGPPQAELCGGSVERTSAPMTYKLGSLFDGSGGFPLAGSLCGIVPVWAAEVEPYPIAVTRSRFPNMRHLGDISKVNGAEIEPVDVITFGSPCQDLSVAGKRAGLKHADNGDEETTRSGLFMEAVRIIKEMREATNGIYPKFALWENVPGAFSSNKGEDFRTVLQELIQIIEPAAVMPAVPQRGWAYADSYCGDGWSLAYRVFDAQYWGVPQRRRRIHLVVDFTGQCARNVLFEREGVRGYFAEGRTPWQGVAAAPENGPGEADREKVYAIDHVITTGGNCTAQGSCIYEEVQATLKACGVHAVAVPYTLKIRSGCEGGGKGALVQENKSATLATNNDQYLFQPVVDGNILDDQGGQQITIRTDGKSPTLRAEMHGNIPCVMQAAAFCPEESAKTRGVGYAEETAPTLRAGATPAVVYRKGTRPHSKEDAQIWEAAEIANTINTFDVGESRANELIVERSVYESHPMDSRIKELDGAAPTVSVKWHKGAADTPLVVEGRPTYSIQGNTIDRNAQQNGSGICENVSHTINADDVAIMDDIVAPLQARDYKGGKLVLTQYIVRRLTPTECARLQGFPDNWGHIEKKDELTPEEYAFWLEVRNTHAAINGKAVKEYTEKQMLTWYNKLHTDSAEYKMWGNGIALPPALYCMQGIVDALRNKK